MADILTTKTFTANASTDVFTIPEGGVTVFLGDADGSDFGGGTITVQYLYSGTDYSDDATTYTAADVFNIKPEVANIQCKLTLSGSTSPDLNVSVLGDS